MTYSRSNPSPRYQELLALYADMHVNGDRLNGIPADMTFSGQSLVPHVGAIKSIIDRFGAKSILDYGSGKAQGYDDIPVPLPGGGEVIGLKNFWEVDEIALYDPGREEIGDLPDRQFDGVISTDVLEHCPEEDMSWIVREIFDHAASFVFCSVALYPAAKKLPTGENAHVTLNSAGWWLDLFEAVSREAAGVRYFLIAMRSPDDMMFIEG